MDNASKQFLSSIVRLLLISLVAALLIGFGIFIFVRSQHVSLFEVSGDSMLPQYHSGELILIKRSKVFHDNQIVFFHPPEIFFKGLNVDYSSKQTFIKKIAATSGQKLVYRGGSFWVDGHLIYSTSDHHYSCTSGSKNYSHVLVNQLFVLGDNALGSLDSRRAYCDGVKDFLVPYRNVIAHGRVIIGS